MVPWHEASEMFLVLRSCGIPAKQLIYDRAQHNDFVLDWSPVKAASGSGGAAGGGAGAGVPVSTSAAGVALNRYGSSSGSSSTLVGAASSSGGSSSAEQLPAFAQDLLAILQGKVQVRFETGSSERTAAAVAALEQAAGLPQLPQQQQRVAQGGVVAAASRQLQTRVPGPAPRL
jgi:hypothetical protein